MKQPAAVGGRTFVFSVAADGLLRGLIPDTGDLALAPAKFLPPNSTANSLIWADGSVYAATSNGCGGAPTAVFAMDFLDEKKTVLTWQSNGAPIVGLALGTDGTVYASTGGGASEFANSVVALDGKTLKIKDWLKHESAFTSTPAVFTEGEKTYVSVSSGSRLYLLDAISLGGADHRRPLFVTADDPNVRFGSDGVATWRDPAGTRWILTEDEWRYRRIQIDRQGRRAGARTRMDVARDANAAYAGHHQRRGLRARRRRHGRERRAVCARSGDRQGALEQREYHHVSRERGTVCRYRTGVCGDAGQHRVVIRHSAGD